MKKERNILEFDQQSNIFDKMSHFFYKKRNKNKDFTLISRDCIGGFVYHQLGLRFLSPTINLFITPEDFNYFCLYLKEYMAGELKEIHLPDITYPVGELAPIKGSEICSPIKIHFMHYENFTQAYTKWNERKERINWNNIYVLSSFCYPVEIESFSNGLAKKWNEIKYKKVMLVDKPYGFENEYVIKKPKDCNEYAWLLFIPGKYITWKRTFNKFNFINFLNKK